MQRKQQTSEQQSTSWAVVGGGMLGMTIALRLAQAGYQVRLLEASDHLGGLADAWELGDVTWDRHYHVTLLSDSYFRDILKELEIDEEMNWVETKTGFFSDGKLHSMSNALEFLRFPVIPLWSKFRLGLTIFAASKIKNWKPLENILVEDWLKRWSGKTTWNRIWRPLLRSKLGDNYKQTSAAFMWATIARLYAARRTGLKKEMFGYAPGGYENILQRMTQKLIDKGVDIRLNERIESVQSDGSNAVVTSTSGSVAYDRVVLTVPSRIVPRLCPQLSEKQRARHSEIQYQGIVCVSLLLDRPLSDYYVTNLTDGNAPFTGVIEMTALVDPREFGGKHLIYLPYYVPEDDPAFERSDEEFQRLSIEGLQTMYPDLRDENVLACRVSRVKQVMAIPTLNYSDKLPPVRTSVPGVYAINSAQIANGTLNVNETVKLAEDAVQNVLLPDSLLSPKETPHHEASRRQPLAGSR